MQRDLFPIWKEVLVLYSVLFYLPEANLLHNLGQCLVGNVGGFLSAFFSALFNVCLVFHYFVEFVLNGLHIGYNAFGNGNF